jgi:glutathione synthase/RimK-type ligase-like ATP-grasp enzyme
MTEPIRIAVGASDNAWDQRFAAALDEQAAQGYPLRYDVVNLDRHDWIERVRPYDVVLWKPNCMGISASAHFKERVYVLERHLGKLVVPNYKTIWHFESKAAQSFLFLLESVPTPQTTVSFDRQDALAQLRQAKMPLVFKRSEGAASEHVRLVAAPGGARRLLERAFCGNRYRAERLRGGPLWKTALRLAVRPWFWRFLWNRWLDRDADGYLYWQEFVTGNEADLRITVIGDQCAYGFWRRNRPGDFRASGSGRIDFERPIPEEPLRYCLELNRRLDFDSMAYDILFQGPRFVINEMSYGYLDSAPYRSRGFYRLHDRKQLTFVAGHVWPQALWVEWALRRAERLQAARGAGS